MDNDIATMEDLKNTFGFDRFSGNKRASELLLDGIKFWMYQKINGIDVDYRHWGIDSFREDFKKASSNGDLKFDPNDYSDKINSRALGLYNSLVRG